MSGPKIKKNVFLMISLMLLFCCSGQYYYEDEDNEQIEPGILDDTPPLNDIAFKILDKKAWQPIIRRIGQQHSYTNYRYVIIGDVRPQVGSHEINLVNPIFISLLDSIAFLRPQPDFVIVLGDLVWSGKEIQYQFYYDLIKNWMEATDIAVFAVPGNHEFLKPGSFEFYEKYIGDLDYCFDWKDSTFVILNNVQHPDDAQYKIEDFQLDFLSSILKTGRQLKFVCTHVPLDGSRGIYQGYMEALDILVEYNVAVSWEAHSHQFRRYWHNGILHIITGGGGAELREDGGEYPPLSFNTEHHFLVADIRGKRVEIKVYFYQKGFYSEDYNITIY